MTRLILTLGMLSLCVPLQSALAVTPWVRVTPEYLKKNPDSIQVNYVRRDDEAQFAVRLRLAKPQPVEMGFIVKSPDKGQGVFRTEATITEGEMNIRFAVPIQSIADTAFRIDVGGHEDRKDRAEPGGNGGTTFEIVLQDFVEQRPPLGGLPSPSGIDKVAEAKNLGETWAFLGAGKNTSSAAVSAIVDTLKELEIPCETKKAPGRDEVVLDILFAKKMEKAKADQIVDECKKLIAKVHKLEVVENGLERSKMTIHFVAFGGGAARPSLESDLFNEGGYRIETPRGSGEGMPPPGDGGMTPPAAKGAANLLLGNSIFLRYERGSKTVALYHKETGWRAHTLDDPVSESPTMGKHIGYLWAGNSLYAFGHRGLSLDRLDFERGIAPTIQLLDDAIIVTHEANVWAYSNSTGTWHKAP